MRDQLMREAKSDDIQKIAERTVDDVRVSMVFSFAGAASFVIEPK
jgi:hypothetical protein